jgi:hypothetical protein
MTAPLEILFTESASDESGDKILTFELSEPDSIRLSLPSSIIVIKTGSLERARTRLSPPNLTYHAVILEANVLNPEDLIPVCTFAHDYETVPLIVLSDVYSKDLFLELARCGVQACLVKRITHEDALARAVLLSIERAKRSKAINDIVIKLRRDGKDGKATK